MMRLFLLYAILIFAKKAPKLITDLLNIKSENLGLKGFSIKNKMGEAALVGDKVKKGMNAVEGGIKKAGGAAKEMIKRGLTNKGKDLKHKLGQTKGGEVAKGLRNGWKSGDDLKSKIKGATSEGHKMAKQNFWSPQARKENADKFKQTGNKFKDALNPKKNMKALKTKLDPSKLKLDPVKLNPKNPNSYAKELKDKLSGLKKAAGKKFGSDNAMKLYGSFVSGFNEYRGKDGTKGAWAQGATIVNPDYASLDQIIDKKLDESSRAFLYNKAGIDTAKEAKNRAERSDIGLTNSGEKIKPQEVAATYLTVDNFKVNGQIPPELYDTNGQLKLSENPIENFTDEFIKKFKEGDLYNSWTEKKQLLFDKYMLKERNEDLTSYKNAVDSVRSLTSTIANAQMANMQVENNLGGVVNKLMSIKNDYENLPDESKDARKLLNEIKNLEINSVDSYASSLCKELYDLMNSKLDTENNKITGNLSEFIDKTDKLKLEIDNRTTDLSGLNTQREELQKIVDKISVKQGVSATDIDFELRKVQEDVSENSQKLSNLNTKPTSSGDK